MSGLFGRSLVVYLTMLCSIPFITLSFHQDIKTSEHLKRTPRIDVLLKYIDTYYIHTYIHTHKAKNVELLWGSMSNHIQWFVK